MATITEAFNDTQIPIHIRPVLAALKISSHNWRTSSVKKNRVVYDDELDDYVVLVDVDYIPATHELTADITFKHRQYGIEYPIEGLDLKSRDPEELAAIISDAMSDAGPFPENEVERHEHSIQTGDSDRVEES